MSRGITQLIIAGSNRRSEIIPESFYLQNFSGSTPDRFDFSMRVSGDARVPLTGDSILLRINGEPRFKGFIRERSIKRRGRDSIIKITCADNTVRLAQTTINFTYINRSIRDIILNDDDDCFLLGQVNKTLHSSH